MITSSLKSRKIDVLDTQNKKNEQGPRTRKTHTHTQQTSKKLQCSAAISFLWAHKLFF